MKSFLNMSKIWRNFILPVLFIFAFSQIASGQMYNSDLGFDLDFSFTHENTSIADFNKGYTSSNKSFLDGTGTLFWSHWYLSVQGSVVFPDLAGAFVSAYPYDFQYALTMLSLSGTLPIVQDPSFESLTLRIGRFPVSDDLSQYLNQTIDGIDVHLEGNFASLGIFSGYTGFVTKHSSFHFTQSDFIDLESQGVYFAPPRLVSGIRGTFFNGTRTTLFSLQGILQNDLRNFLQPQRIIPEGVTTPGMNQEGGTFDTIAVIPSFSIMPNPALKLDFQGIFQTGTTQVKNDVYQNIAMLSGSVLGNIEYSINETNSIKMKTMWSSGDGPYREDFDEGSSVTESRTFVHLYKPLNPVPVGFIYDIHPGNMTWLQLGWYGKPFQAIPGLFGKSSTIHTGFSSYLRNSEGPIQDTRANPNSPNPYLGTEIFLALISQPFSDLKFGFYSGIFAPATYPGGAYHNRAPLVEAALNAFVNLSF